MIFSEGRRGVEGATDKVDPLPAPTPVSQYSKKASLPGCPSESYPLPIPRYSSQSLGAKEGLGRPGLPGPSSQPGTLSPRGFAKTFQQETKVGSS